MKLSDLKSQASPPRVLIYGKVGCGKTALALTLGARAQVLDWDDGLKTGISVQDKFTPDRLSVDVKQFLEPDPMRRAEAFARGKAYIYSLGAEIQAKRFPFEVIIIDTLSSFADSAVRYIMSNSGKLGMNPEIQHWGLAFTEIKNVLAVLRSLPLPIILLAHEQVKSIGTGADREDSLEIAISGKNLPSQVCRYFDEIWYMRSKPMGGGKFQYVVQTASDSTIEARSRSCLPNMTDTSVGLWELLKRVGYQERKP